MRFTISGKNIDVTEGLKAAVTDKLGKLEKYFTPDTEIIVTLSVEKERQKIEVTIPVKGNKAVSKKVSSANLSSLESKCIIEAFVFNWYGGIVTK